jgi:hypothetical protein
MQCALVGVDPLIFKSDCKICCISADSSSRGDRWSLEASAGAAGGTVQGHRVVGNHRQLQRLEARERRPCYNFFLAELLAN